MGPWGSVLLAAAGVVLAVLGLAGLVLPALPGFPLLFGGILLVAWADGFAHLSWPGLLAIGLLGVLGGVLDYAAALLGAKHAGASRWGLLGAALGLLVGLFFGIPGLILGPVVGAGLLEYARDSDLRRSARAGGGVLVGFLLGTVLKYAVAMAMIGAAVLAWAW